MPLRVVLISREATGQEAAIPTGFCLSASLSPLALRYQAFLGQRAKRL